MSDPATPRSAHHPQTEPVAPGVFRLRFGRPEAITPVTVREKPVQTTALAEMGGVSGIPLDPGRIGFSTAPRGCVLELPLDPEERIFGLGLQLKSLEQTNLKKVLRTNSDPVADTGDSHAPVPFYLSTRGYGVLVDTARYAAFYCGSHAPAARPPKVMRDDSGAIADTAEALYRRERGPRGPVVVDIPAAGGVDIYLFSGPDLLGALRRYILFSGGGCLPPMWGLGNWYRTCVRHTQEEALELARGLRRAGIPVDVFGLEPGWHAHAYACNYLWHPQRFPEPEHLTRALRNLGFRLNLWEHVFADESAPFYGQLKDHAGNFRVWGGLVPDLLQPQARALFEDHHEEAFVRRGVAGFKLDECDNSDFIVYPWSFPEASRFPSGADGEQMHSLFGLQYQRMIDRIYRRNDRRSLGQVRSSHALAGPYPFVLYSDLYEHRDFLRGVCTAPLGGLLWSPEVRQCASAEDLFRRLQSVVLSPQSLVNGWMIRNPPWKQVDKDRNNAGAFMEDWPAVQERCRRIFEWRMRLLPYLYAAFARYAVDGTPPFRPLVLDYPGDSATHRIDDAWLVGDDLLVAPVVAGETRRKVYLPEHPGGWFDLHTGEIHAGGRQYGFDTPVDRCLIFVRAGALLPVAEPVSHVAPDTVFRITVHAFGESFRPALLFEDDFESFAFERGESNRVRLEASLDEAGGITGTVDRRGAYPVIRYRIEGWRRADECGVAGFTC